MMRKSENEAMLRHVDEYRRRGRVGEWHDTTRVSRDVHTGGRADVVDCVSSIAAAWSEYW